MSPASITKQKCRLIDLVVKASASRAADLGFDSRPFLGNFSGLSHTGDHKIGTPVATLSGVWQYRVSSGTGFSLVSVCCDWTR